MQMLSVYVLAQLAAGKNIPPPELRAPAPHAFTPEIPHPPVHPNSVPRPVLKRTPIDIYVESVMAKIERESPIPSGSRMILRVRAMHEIEANIEGMSQKQKERAGSAGPDSDKGSSSSPASRMAIDVMPKELLVYTEPGGLDLDVEKSIEALWFGFERHEERYRERLGGRMGYADDRIDVIIADYN